MATINVYKVYFKNGETAIITASNISGAKAQMLGVLPHVSHIERIYKGGQRV